jgi:hypothetical protein
MALASGTPSMRKRSHPTQHDVSERDLRLLFALECELPSLRKSLQLAGLIAEAPELAENYHPVLEFALQRAPTAVVENLLLRALEIAHTLDRALHATTGDRLVRGKSRQGQLTDPVLQLACDLRHQQVAHRIGVLNAPRGPAWESMVSQHGTVWRFLSAVLDAIEIHLATLRRAGVFNRTGLTAWAVAYRMFTAADVAELIEVANSLPVARRHFPGRSES